MGSCPLVSLGESKREKLPKIPGFKACHKLTQCFDSEKNSGIFLGLYTSLGLRSNSPPWIKQAKLTSTPNQTTSLERFLTAARAGLIYPCLGPVPMITTSPRNSDRVFFVSTNGLASDLCWFWSALFHACELPHPPRCFDGFFLQLLFLFCALSLVCNIIRKLFHPGFHQR